jgi:hypothetical protein
MFVRNLKCYLRRMKPYVGNWFIESQVFMFVFQWDIDPTDNVKPSGLVLGRLSIWRDSCWKV